MVTSRDILGRIKLFFVTGRFVPTEQTLENLKETHALGGSEVSTDSPQSQLQLTLSGYADQNDAVGKVHHGGGRHEEVAVVRQGHKTQVGVNLIRIFKILSMSRVSVGCLLLDHVSLACLGLS